LPAGRGGAGGKWLNGKAGVVEGVGAGAGLAWTGARARVEVGVGVEEGVGAEEAVATSIIVVVAVGMTAEVLVLVAVVVVAGVTTCAVELDSEIRAESLPVDCFPFPELRFFFLGVSAAALSSGKAGDGLARLSGGYIHRVWTPWPVAEGVTTTATSELVELASSSPSDEESELESSELESSEEMVELESDDASETILCQKYN
jgi:hypothetical protein